MGKNNIYFLLESIEERFMAHMVSQLMESHKFSSILWLHDGIWFAPFAEKATVDHAIRVAQLATHCPTVRVKYSNLASQRDQILRQLPIPEVLHAGLALRKNLCTAKPRGVKRKPLALSTAQTQVQATGKKRRCLELGQLTLQQFINRKRKAGEL